jgi:spore coat protein CotH
MKKLITLILISFILIGLASCDELNYEFVPNPVDPNDEEPTEVLGTFERLFDDIVYRKISIHITEENWLELNQDLLDHQSEFGNLKTDEYVLADMVYEDEQGVIEIDHIGFRTRGNLSLQRLIDDDGNINMNSFKINFREQFEGLHPENSGRRGFELKELDLKWNRNYDETYITEAYALDMFNHFGVYAAQTSHVLLSIIIDDEETLMGLYTAFEPIDDEFIERRLTKTESDGDLYKSLWQQYGPATLEPITNPDAIGIRDVTTNYMPAYDLKTNKDTSTHSALLDFIDKLNNLSDTELETYLNQYFEVEMFLRLLAVNVFIGNPDDYRAMGNNYFLYQNSENLRWSMIPYDFDHGLGQGWWQQDVYPNYSIGVDIYEWFDLNDALTGTDYKHPLVDRILANSTYKALYDQILNDILNDIYFTTNYFISKHNDVKAAFEGRFDDALHHQSFGLRNVESYMNDKRNDVYQQLVI